MRKVGFATLVVTLILGPGVAEAGPPPTGWGQDGYGPGNTHYNPGETVVNAASLGRLAERWTVRLAPGRPGCAPAQAAPLAVDDRVVLRDGDGVAAYRAATGRRLWTGAGFRLVTAGPLVAGGLTIAADTACDSNSSYDGAVTALDAATGAPRWRQPGAWTIDQMVADAGTVVVSGHCDTCDDARHNVSAYRLGDGKPLWSRPNQVLAGPVSAGGTVLLRRTTGRADTWATAIATGRPVWGTDLEPTVVAANPAGTVLYLKDGSGLCARATADGERLWQIPKEAGDLATDGRRVYVASAGRVNTYAAKTGRLLWTRALTLPREPVRAGGLLYVLTGKGTLAVLDAADGRPVATKATYNGLTAHVVPAGGRLLVSRQGVVRAYAP
jgi:outer membrane protein assembly factor BamB